MECQVQTHPVTAVSDNTATEILALMNVMCSWAPPSKVSDVLTHKVLKAEHSETAVKL